jgi:hypothetical protein
MSNIVDRVFAEVCLDERIKDGIFKLEEEEHMNALRDYFVKKGITQEAAVHVTNQMVEGRFPERQAYNKDGILVTFPTPQHKGKAIQRGTHFEKNPAPQNTTPPKQEPQGVPVPQKELPPQDVSPKEEPSGDKDLPKTDDKEPEGGVVNKVSQGETELEVEPPRGAEKPEPPPVPQSPTPPPAPRTPERVAAEKEVAKQILATKDTALSPVEEKIDEAALRYQLNEIYRKCDEWGFREMQRFLNPHIKH